LNALAIGLFVVASLGAFAEDSSKRRQSFLGTIDKTDLRSKTLSIWVPGCDDDSVKTYTARSGTILSEVKAGDVVRVSVHTDTHVLQDIEVLTPRERALGFLFLCGGGGNGALGK
jgi:hypothetical protein